jgi:hemolysin activation/secretion protein
VNIDGIRGTACRSALRDRRPSWLHEVSVLTDKSWRTLACCLMLGTIDVRTSLAQAQQSGGTQPSAQQQPAAKPSSGQNPSDGKPGTAMPPATTATVHFDIDEFRVEGADSLPQIDVETAVYPFLGPNRSADDVEKARTALEKTYHDKGLQTVGVSVPQQDATRGFIVLKVTENRVGRVRVKNSRYFDLAKIKKGAPSLQEGVLPDLKDVTRDITALNRWPDRRVTPAFRAGVTPGTVDVDLDVQDTFPLHGSAELNDRQSPSTTPLRETYTAHYDDLWQLGHSFTVTYQDAPLNPKDAQVISGSYLARTDLDWLNVLVYGLKSWSNVATVGGANVVGPGQVIGTRVVMSLPAAGELIQTVSLGVDYKSFGQTLSLGSDSFSSPVTYVPVVATYGASWQGQGRLTQLNATVTAGLRGIGSSPDDFDAKRYDATANFIKVNGDVSHTQDLPGGAQLFVKMQGQVADQPLVSSEQLSVGGQDTVRGYLESEVLGDYGIIGTLELRSPSLAPYLEQKLENPLGEPIKFNAFNDWRFYAFADVARAGIYDPLPDQQAQFDLASYGIGTQLKSLSHFNAVVFVAMPLVSQQVTLAHHPRLSFRIWGEF